MPKFSKVSTLSALLPSLGWDLNHDSMMSCLFRFDAYAFTVLPCRIGCSFTSQFFDDDFCFKSTRLTAAQDGVTFRISFFFPAKSVDLIFGFFARQTVAKN